MLLPLILFQRRVRPEAKLILAFSSIYGFLWLLTAQHARYLLAVLPGLAVLSGISVSRLVGSLPWAGCPGLCLGRVGSIGGNGNVQSAILRACGFARYGSTIMEKLPLQYLLGLESKDQYLARHIDELSGRSIFQSAFRGRNICSFGGIQTLRSTTSRAQRPISLPLLSPICSEQDPAEIHRLLKENGVTHLLTARVNQDAHLITRPEGEFARTYLKPLFQKNASVLYEVASAPLNQEGVHYDFLTHIGEASIRVPAEPAGKPNTAYRIVGGGEGDSRYSLLAFPPAAVEFSLSLCEQPVLQFAVGQTIPSCSGKGSFEIWLAEATGEPQRIYSRELYAEKKPCDVGWFEERVDLSAFASKQVKDYFQNETPGRRLLRLVLLGRSGDPVQTPESSPSGTIWSWHQPVGIAKQGSLQQVHRAQLRVSRNVHQATTARKVHGAQRADPTRSDFAVPSILATFACAPASCHSSPYGKDASLVA